jgi:hypothetical protein
MFPMGKKQWRERFPIQERRAENHSCYFLLLVPAPMRLQSHRSAPPLPINLGYHQKRCDKMKSNDARWKGSYDTERPGFLSSRLSRVMALF